MTRISSLTARRLLLSLFVLGVLAPAAAVGDDWPQWRGPGRDGVSAETGLLGSWPEGGPPLAWSASGLGSGFSSVAVVGDRVYTLGDSDGKQHAVAIESPSGKTLWKSEIGDAWEDSYGGPRGTPTIDGDRMYLVNTEGVVYSLSLADGSIVWTRDLVADFGGVLMQAMGRTDWRFSESPLVDGDRVIVTPGSKEAALVALDKETGKEIWRTAIPDLGGDGADGAGYSSVVVSEGAGVRQYVQLIGRGVIGVEAESGRFLWSYTRVANDIANIATPLIDGDYVFASTGYGTGSALLELVPAEGGVEAKEVYFLAADTMQNHHGGMVLRDGYVYTGTGHNKGFPLAVEMATGEVAWGPERNAGTGSAAIAYADGRVYLRYQNGVMVQLEATPEGYRETGSFEIPDVSKPSWSHPVIAGGKLYLREQDRLYCYEVEAPQAAAAAAPSSGAGGSR